MEGDPPPTGLPPPANDEALPPQNNEQAPPVENNINTVEGTNTTPPDNVPIDNPLAQLPFNDEVNEPFPHPDIGVPAFNQGQNGAPNDLAPINNEEGYVDLNAPESNNEEDHYHGNGEDGNTNEDEYVDLNSSQPSILQDFEGPDETYNIYVGNLNAQVNEEDLKQVFVSCGKIASVRVFRDKNTGEHMVCG